MKLLITGADGQLGQALKATCADQQIPVIDVLFFVVGIVVAFGVVQAPQGGRRVA